MDIAVAGTGYVGLSLAVLLAQNNSVKAVDIFPIGQSSLIRGSLLLQIRRLKNIWLRSPLI